MGSKKSNIKEDQDGPGPDQYSLKLMSGAPLCSFGGRFDSDVRSKDHIHPKKKDGPGPGSYVLPSGLKVYKPLTGGNAKRTTWGKAAREWSDLPKGVPAPNNYAVLQFTEASHQYSMPRATRTDEAKAYKSSFAPGPGAYEIRREDR
jgi:hypothetical protein